MRLDIVLGNQALNLSKRDADVAIRATDHPPETLVGRRVGAHRMGALWPGRRLSADPMVLDPSSLYRRHWVSLGDDLAAMQVARSSGRTSPPERIAYKVNTVLGLAEAIEAGIGIGHLPCFIADVRPALIRLAPPDPASPAICGC